MAQLIAFFNYFILSPACVFLFVAWLSQGKSHGLSKDFPLKFRIIAFFRAPTLMFIVIPLSFCLNLYIKAREIWRQITHHNDPEGHRARCDIVVRQILAWNEQGRPRQLRTARPNWAAMSTKRESNKESCALISTSHLNHILEIDEKNLTITCEPRVSMGQITHALLPRGLALKCQIEMESLTIGGISSGWGLETNSYTHGFFQETVCEYEICVSDGTVLKVNKENNPDLFYALPWSHGSIGFLLSVTVELIRVKPYVKIAYVPTFSAKELQEKLEYYTVTNPTHIFVEATIYTKDKAVIQLGDFVDKPKDPSRMNGINHFWKPFYFKHVETFLEKGEGWEVVPIKHFYHRFTRSIFWELETMIPFSNHPIYRCLWGWMGAPEVSLLKFFQNPSIRKAATRSHVVQESIMPLSKFAEAVENFDTWFGVYPLLVFPIRIYGRGKHSGFLTPRDCDLIQGENFGMWVDLGAYGVPRHVRQGRKWDPKEKIRAMERWTREVGGFQATYTDLYCTRHEFRQMFNHDLYDEQRKKYNAISAFPEVYDKIRPEKGIADLSDISPYEGRFSEQRKNDFNRA
jgi:Delta24-sterol reductase